MLKKIFSERGSAIAGLALALPMFLGLMLGVADLGRGYMTYIAMSSKSKYTQDDIVEVRVEYDYDILFGAIPTLKDFTFVVKATMRVMYDPEWELS